jgi:hypothetical protein
MNAIQQIAPAVRCAAEIATRHAGWDKLEFSKFEPAYMFANRYGYSDIDPGEVVRRVSEKCIEIRMMDAERDKSIPMVVYPGGFARHVANQRSLKWHITSNPANPIIRIRKQKNGDWKDAGGNRYGLTAEPVKFYDYNF